MAKILQTLIPLALLLATAQSSTYFNYDFSTQQHVSLLYQGDAHFPSDDSTRLRLTKTNASDYPETNSVGRVLYSEPVTLSSDGEMLDFATSITFKITPVDNRPAEGLAFFIAPFGTTIPKGGAGGSLGIFGADGSDEKVVAVEFDIFFNPGTDGSSFPHVGIDIESPISSNVTVVGDVIIGHEVSAYVTYEHGSRKIVVSVVAAGSQNFVVSYVKDLSTLIPEKAQVGISAATGGGVAIHDVTSWYFLSFADSAGAKIRPVFNV